ncbi:MAG: hypothetical protein NT011_13015 [Kiritimatiellaeota bacterium]|nr:hypothetical protein [Kiritimatiellota bacterium]
MPPRLLQRGTNQIVLTLIPANGADQPSGCIARLKDLMLSIDYPKP